MPDQEEKNNNSGPPNLRRYGDELESSIGAIFDSIDFSSIEKQASNEEGGGVDSGNRIRDEVHSQTATTNDDDMKNAINNALDDVFDFKSEPVDRVTNDEIKNDHNAGDEHVKSTFETTQLMSESRPTGVALGSSNPEIDDAINLAFNNLLEERRLSREEQSQKATAREEPHQLNKKDTNLSLEKHSLMQSPALEKLDPANEFSTRQDKALHKKTPSLTGNQQDEGNREKQKSDKATSAELNNNQQGEDDELESAIRNALGNLFDNQSPKNASNESGQIQQEKGYANSKERNKIEMSESIKPHTKHTEHSAIELHDYRDNARGQSIAPPRAVDKALNNESMRNQNGTTTDANDNLDESLRGIIGQAFDEIFGKESSDVNSNAPDEVNIKDQHRNVSDLKLSEARSGPDPNLSSQLRANVDTHISRPQINSSSAPSFNTHYDDHEDRYLVEAIGAAFRSIEEATKSAVTSQPSPDFHSSVDEERIVGKRSDERYNQLLIEGVEADNATSDQDIEDAIADAFKSAMQSEHFASHDDTSQGKIEQQLRPTLKKKSVKSLAKEITQQVQDHFKDERRVRGRLSPVEEASNKGTASTVKKHVLHNIGSQKTEEKLHTAITSAVKIATGIEKDDEIVDIEQLQMNDILHNAIKMASENPQELISDLEIDQIIGIGDSQTARILGGPNTTDLKAFKAKPPPAKHFKPANDQLRVPPSLEEKSKSAIPRKVQKGDDNQFSVSSKLVSNEDAAKNSLLSNPDIKSQLSSVMSSLTSRINSGELADTNILFTIRQITEELASGGSLANFLSNQTPLEDFKSSNEEADRKMLANALGMARHFLLGFPSEPQMEAKSIDEINAMISNLNEDFSSTNLLLSNERAEFISSIANLTLTTLVDENTNVQYSFEVFDEIEKFRNSSPEARRRTRVGNRERKKKWREENAERNRDIELRTRVTKKALVDFGVDDTPEKLSWIESEISKRKSRRQARSQAEDERNDGDAKVENAQSCASNDKVHNVAQDRRLINQVKDVLKIFFERPDKSKQSSHLITAATVIGALSLIHSESINLDEDIMLAGMKSILKTITEHVHILDAHRSRLSLAALHTEASKRRLSEILLNSKRLKVDPVALARLQDTMSQPLHINDGIVSKPSLQLPRTSPFISHKVGNNASIGSSTGLRKPGSFQKPRPFEKPVKDKNRRESLGSPKLYSTT